MGGNEFQYSQVPLDIFIKNFITTKPKEYSKAFMQNIGGLASSAPTGHVSGKCGDPKALSDTLSAIIGDPKCRFLVCPRAPDAEEPYAPAAALFTKPRKVNLTSFWAWMISPVDVIADESEAGFYFSPPNGSHRDTLNGTPPFVVESAEGRRARRNLEQCISEILLHQHRLHIFMLHIAESAARVSRWDRAGCIVSEPIDLPGRLFDFQDVVFRLAWLPPLLQGFDDTVKLATKLQIKQLEQYKPRSNKYLMEYRANILNNAEEYPIYEVTCPNLSSELAETLALMKFHSPGRLVADEDSDDDDEAGLRRTQALPGFNKKPKQYLIGCPTTDRRPLAGRSTVGYVVFDLDAKRMSFLKDQWRGTEELRSEIDVYKHLRGRNVYGIASLEAGGDIQHHQTRSQGLMQGLPFSNKSVRRVHMRLVTKNVGRPLETFENSAELLRYISCARYSSESAWKLAGVLHHDTSLGNILIDVESDDAFLNDWDVAVFRSVVKHKYERSGFSGTWAYASALVLQYPKKPIEVEDEIEAFIWLLAYLGMRFFMHNLTKARGEPNPELNDLMNKLFFEEEENEYGHSVGGKTKMFYIKMGKPPVQLKNRNSPLALFLDGAFKLLKDVYSKVDYKAIKHWTGSLAGPHAFIQQRGDKSVLDGLSHAALNKLLYEAYSSAEIAQPSEQEQPQADDPPVPDLI